MIDNSQMIHIFGQENLVYANKDKLTNIPLSDKTKEFVLKTGFPYLISYLRFTLDFEPILEDIKIGNSINNFSNYLTIGYKPFSPLIGTVISVSELGLEENASLLEIKKKAEVLGANEYYGWDIETKYSWRICLDLENNNRIVYINPEEDLSIGFFNYNLKTLALSLAIFKKHLYYENNKTIKQEMSVFEKQMESIDPKALENKKNLWKILIEWTLNEAEEY